MDIDVDKQKVPGWVEVPGLPAASAALDAHTLAMMEIDGDYGDEAPYNLDRAIGEAKFYLSQSADAIIEAGKRLLLIKEHEGHGNFLSALERIGVEHTAATRLMKIAVKFGKSNIATLQRLNLNKGKLLELAILDDDEIQGLGEGETVRGLTLDAVDTMSVRELRAALRKEQTDRKGERAKLGQAMDAQQRIIDEKNRRIDELAMGHDARQAEIPNDPARRYEYDLIHGSMQITSEINTTLVGRLAALRDICGDKEYERFQLNAAQALGKIIFAARAVAQEWGVVPAEQPAHAFASAAGDEDAAIWAAVNADLTEKD